MTSLIHPTILRSISAILLMMSCCAVGLSQEEKAPPVAAVEIPGLIADLASPAFVKRTTAARRLRNAGDAAIEPLRAALEKATVDQKVLINDILSDLEKNSFSVRIKTLSQSPTLENVAGLPEWDRFATLVGDNEAAIRNYARIVSAEVQLFAEAAKQSRQVSDLLRERATELLQSTRPSPVMLQRFSVDSYAAILLLAGNKTIRLPGTTSTSISTMLRYADFTDAVKADGGQWYLRLVGSYIQRGRISVVGPLEFAREHKMPEGLVLARDVLQNSLRGQNGLYAMAAIRDLGSEKDLPLLESLFDNRGEIFMPKASTPESSRYSVYNCDLALAVSIFKRGKDPRDFGFPVIDDPKVPFRFALETVGFNSESDRKKAFASYGKSFSK